MKIVRTSATLGLAALTVCSGSFAAADDSGWYVGLNLGLSQAEIDEGSIRAALTASGFSTLSFDDDDSDIGGKVFGGYQFTRHFAVESGYFDLGEFDYTATTSPPGSLTGKTKMRGYNFDPVFTWPITEKFSVLGRVGYTYAKASTSYSATGTVTPPGNRTKRAGNYKYGIGVQYDFTERFGMRAEAENYRIDDAVGNEGDIELYSLGLVYRFFDGSSDPGPQAVAQAPAPVAAPAPVPVPVVVPVPTETKKYCSILDIEFEIDADEIQREEKERLAVLGTFLKKYPDTTAVIEGHTDNVGTTEDNMSLSVRRAESVVKYLVDEFAIAPSRLTAVGYGDSRPVGNNSTEEGKRANRRIGAVIACARDIEGLKVKPARMTMALDMEFDQSKAGVQPEYREELRQVATFLKENPSVTATVEGHAANPPQGASETSMELSRRRAESVVNYLVNEFGIARSRLSAEGFGQTRRVAYNTSTEGQQENRRVNVIINYPKR